MIRIIGGTQKGKKLDIADTITKPLTDRIKTSIFDIIREFLPNSKVLDLFGGSGSFALEALSRGAKKAFIVELNPEAIEIIKKNVLNTNFYNKSTVLQRDAFIYAKAIKSKEDFDIIFLDPPFPFSVKEKQHLLSLCLDLLNTKNPDSLLIFRYPKDELHSNNKGVEVFSQNYGISKVSFYRKSPV
jgi:16S rRNA (guanine966-N2)-methyltransferase